jgi:hemoglobin
MLRGRHAPFFINQTARDRWVQLMDNALEQCRFSLQVSTVIRSFLAHVATFLINQ